MAQHPIQYAESHGNFLNSVSPPDTARAAEWWLSAAMLYAVMQNHVGLCVLLSGSVSPQRKSEHPTLLDLVALIYSICGTQKKTGVTKFNKPIPIRHIGLVHL